jgi:hypothetical protein
MRRRTTRPPPRTPASRSEHEAIALRIRQIASAACVIAEAQGEPLSHALYLIEESLLEVEERVLRLLPVKPAKGDKPGPST